MDMIVACLDVSMQKKIGQYISLSESVPIEQTFTASLDWLSGACRALFIMGGVHEFEVTFADWNNPNVPRKMHSLNNSMLLDLEVIQIPFSVILNSFRRYFHHN